MIISGSLNGFLNFSNYRAFLLSHIFLISMPFFFVGIILLSITIFFYSSNLLYILIIYITLDLTLFYFLALQIYNYES